jgi:hypothetical protein
MLYETDARAHADCLLQMLAMFNAQERTAREMRVLLASVGWDVVEVRRAAGNGGFGYVIAVPAATSPSTTVA